MAVEKEKGPEKNEEGQMSNEELARMVLELKSQLDAQKANNQPQVAQIPAAGMSNEQFQQLIGATVKSLRERPDVDKYGPAKFVSKADIDPDDYDEVGKEFCAYSTGYVIVDDVRNGHSVATPFNNVIFFKYQATQTTPDPKKGDKYQNTVTYSSWTSHSKREQQWLREHKYFGIKFFDNAHDALNADAEKHQRLANIIDNMDNLTQDRVISMCKENNVPINQNIRVMKINLAFKLVDKLYASEKQVATKRVAAAAGAEEELFKA